MTRSRESETPAMTFTPLDLMTDRTLFASRFGSATFAAWRTLVTVAFGLARTLTTAARQLAERCTARTQFPTAQVRELWLIIGRRGGKSLMAALLLIYLSCFRTYRLAPGERGIVMLIAADRRQARVVKRYVSALLHELPMLAALVTKETKEAIHLSNGIDIEIHTASFRAIRGYTVVGAVLDELAFWPNDDAADPDTEILNALRPAMATVAEALLVVISSPYARRGELWRMHKEHFGQDTGDILIWQSDTETMNPTVPASVIARAYADDESAAAAEYGAQFRADVESFIRREILDAAVVTGRYELPPLGDCTYHAFVDPSGGGQDSFTLAISHKEYGRIVLDAVRETKPPFSPESVVAEYAALLRSYRLDRVTGDRYAGEWPREAFRNHGVDYDCAEKNKSDIYRDVLPLFNSSKVELLDHPRTVQQFANLERRTARGGRDSIDHAPKSHDDVANAVAGAILLAQTELPELIFG